MAKKRNLKGNKEKKEKNFNRGTLSHNSGIVVAVVKRHKEEC